VNPRRRYPHTRAAAEHRLRATASALDRAFAERDGAILDAAEFGLPARRIAELTGLTHPTVMRTVRRWEDADPT
jgi:DNA-directed RNA polymerase specialized sigma24 family protein